MSLNQHLEYQPIGTGVWTYASILANKKERVSYCIWRIGVVWIDAGVTANTYGSHAGICSIRRRTSTYCDMWKEESEHTANKGRSLNLRWHFGQYGQVSVRVCRRYCYRSLCRSRCGCLFSAVFVSLILFVHSFFQHVKLTRKQVEGGGHFQLCDTNICN